MQTKFTPGPWHVERDEEQYPFKAFIDDNNGVSSDDGRNYYLATVEHGSSSELTANATLIAAAPEMYEALQFIYADGLKHEAIDCGDHCHNTCPWCIVRTALQKANGGQQ